MKKAFKWIRRALWLSLILMLAAVLVAPLYIYDRFNAEQPIATLVFDRLTPRHYMAYVASQERCAFNTYELHGDQWQLDAHFLKWQGPAILMGFESRYRLDRLTGRYADIQQQNRLGTHSHDLSPEVYFDIFAIQSLPILGEQLVDAQLGSSVYMAIDPDKRYTVYKSEDGLFARSEPLPANVVDDQKFSIAEAGICHDQQSVMAQLATGINRVVVRLLQVVPG